MSQKDDERMLNAVERIIGRKRISEMTGDQYAKAVAQVTAELMAPKAAKSNRK